jgi:hypothetical protein
MVARESVFKLESSYIETCIVHKLLEDTHEVSIAKTKTNQPVPVQQSGWAFEGVRMPRSVLQINIEDVRALEHHSPDARSISIQQGICFQKLTMFGKFLQFVRATRQHVWTMSSLCKTSGRLDNTSGRYLVIQITPDFCSIAERISVKIVRTLGQAVRTQT